MIELRNITKRFGDVLANDRISIKVTPGTIHAIVGENGAGKIYGDAHRLWFLTADSGEILINGEVREFVRRMTRSRSASAWCISTSCWLSR